MGHRLPLNGCREWGILLFVAAGLGGGCDRLSNPEPLRQRVLKVDPHFAETLEKRDELADRIAVLQRELALKKSQVEHHIEQLRKEFAETRAQVHQKIQDTQAQLRPEQSRAEFALSMATEELKAKRSQRDSIGRSISRIRKALKQDSRWTDADQARLNQELQDLLGEAKRLDQEIAALTSHVKLLKAKHRLLTI